MYYELSFNMDKIDQTLGTSDYSIYAEVSNLEEIKYGDIKQGWFKHIIYDKNKEKIQNWPVIDFYYLLRIWIRQDWISKSTHIVVTLFWVH